MGNSDYWELRLNNIKENVSLRSLVDSNGIACQSVGEITQLHCPFHGNDQHASARIYETNTMYCWVCSKIWDVVSFIQDYKGISFIESCSFLESAYGLEKPDSSISYQEESFNDYLKTQSFQKELNFDRDFLKLSKTLVNNRDKFSLENYIRYFDYFDKIQIKYSKGTYKEDTEIKNSLDYLLKEISYNI